MKILLLSTNADEAGAPRHVETIVNGLEKEFEFVLVFGEEGPVSHRIKNRGHVVHIVHEMRTPISPIKDLVALVKIFKIIRQHRPDIVHCHSAKAGMLGRLASFLNNTKWVYTVHGWGWRGVSRFTKMAVIFIEWLLSKLPNGYYIFVAKDVMSDAISLLNIKQNRGRVIYNGAPSVEITPPPQDVPLNIMMPARVCSAKDHESLIVAFEQFNDSNSRLLLCGSGTDSPDFVSFAKSLAPRSFNNICFLGQRSDIDDFYARSHIVALISHFEALPLSIIEAMSYSKGVLATDVGGVSELIQNGVNGILVRKKSVDDIAKALNVLKEKKTRENFGQNAEISFAAHFSVDVMLKTLSLVYTSLSSGSK